MAGEIVVLGCFGRFTHWMSSKFNCTKKNDEGELDEGGSSTTTVTCTNLFSRMVCCRSCNCCSSTTVGNHGNYNNNESAVLGHKKRRGRQMKVDHVSLQEGDVVSQRVPKPQGEFLSTTSILPDGRVVTVV